MNELIIPRAIKTWDVSAVLENGIILKIIDHDGKIINEYKNLSAQTARELGTALIEASGFMIAQNKEQGNEKK